jgi:hypothetical protein
MMEQTATSHVDRAQKAARPRAQAEVTGIYLLQKPKDQVDWLNHDLLAAAATTTTATTTTSKPTPAHVAGANITLQSNAISLYQAPS